MPRPTLSDDTLEELGRLLHDQPPDECHAWLDWETGEVILATSLYGLEEEDGEDEGVVPLRPGGLGEVAKRVGWQEEERRRVAAILADPTGRYLRVPIGLEAGAPGLLRGFADSLSDPALRDAVLDAMRGRGAFRRVKDLLHRRGQIDLWHDYEAERFRESAREWLAEGREE